MKLLSRSEMRERLLSDRKVLIKALVALNNRQTDDEKRDGVTKYLNNAGFRPCHAGVGTSMVDFFNKTGFLTDKQCLFWTKERGSKPRILIYFNQLYRIHLNRYSQFLHEKGEAYEKSKLSNKWSNWNKRKII